MCREKTSRKNITYLELKLHISFLMLWNEEARNTYYCCYYQNEEQFVISTNGALFRMTQGRFWAILHIWTARPWTSWNRRNKETWVSLLAIPHKYIPIGTRASKFISYNHIKKMCPKKRKILFAELLTSCKLDGTPSAFDSTRCQLDLSVKTTLRLSSLVQWT